MKAPVRIGDLKHRVRLESATRVADGGGGSTAYWDLVADVWAAIWPRSADEPFSLDRAAGRATHDIWIRKRDGVKPEMRFVFGTRIFDILGVLDVEDKGRFLRCPAEERDL